MSPDIFFFFEGIVTFNFEGIQNLAAGNDVMLVCVYASGPTLVEAMFTL